MSTIMLDTISKNGDIKYFELIEYRVKLLPSMKTTEHLLLQLHKASAKQLVESVVCVRHNTPGYVQIKVVFPRATTSNAIITLRKHIVTAYKNTDASISVINDETHADTDAIKIQMKIKAPVAQTTKALKNFYQGA